MRHLSIDIETYSNVNIGKTGLHKYSLHSSGFEILLFAYSFDFGAVHVVDLAQGEKVPQKVIDALVDADVIKHAYNAAFEITCLLRAGYKTYVPQWQDTMLMGSYLGYPLGLSSIGNALGLSDDKKKSGIGKALIRYFCCPVKPTKTNGGRTRNLPMHDLEKWKLFIEYNRQDVVTEMEVYQKLVGIPLPDTVQKEWVLDYYINGTGITLDVDLVDGALAIDEEHKEKLMARAVEITGLANPNSRTQLLSWLNDNTAVSLNDLTKDTLAKTQTEDPVAAELIGIRKKLAKSSVSKYAAMAATLGPLDRVRGLLQFYGARTGRWAGRLVQVQNLPRNYLANLDLARNLVKAKNSKGLELLFGDVSDTLSQLIRTAFIAPAGKKLCVADFSAIEARVLAWLADEQWKMDIFATTGKIYEATAARMFGVSADKIKKGNPEYELRQKGKIAELALGYGGGPNALIAMGALDKGIEERELPGMVKRWRNANQGIVNFWQLCEEAAKKAITMNGQPITIEPGLTFRVEFSGALRFLAIKLPSGRSIYYPEPCFIENRFGNESIGFKTQVGIRWCNSETYGGKLVENITQAVARDCLAVALTRVADTRMAPLMHIHDEIVMEVPDDGTDHLKTAIDIMCQPIPWAPGLVLNADGFENIYYKKE